MAVGTKFDTLHLGKGAPKEFYTGGRNPRLARPKVGALALALATKLCQMVVEMGHGGLFCVLIERVPPWESTTIPGDKL